MEEGDANRGKQAATRSQDRKKGRERDSALVSPEKIIQLTKERKEIVPELQLSD